VLAREVVDVAVAAGELGAQLRDGVFQAVLERHGRVRLVGQAFRQLRRLAAAPRGRVLRRVRFFFHDVRELGDLYFNDG